MRIHSRTVTEADIYKAARSASEFGHGRAYVHHLSRHGSRSHGTAYDVALVGDGTVNRRRTQADRDEFAATWDQWGVFLAELFLIDPDMKAGPYKGRESFNTQTGDLFASVGRKK